MSEAGSLQAKGTATGEWFSADRVVFVALLALTCAWILSLPVFPSQDGPAHRYYAHILGQLFDGNNQFATTYQVRHPFPPYASQDFVMVMLSRLMDINLADKLFVCLIAICTAIGIRWSCMSLGPGGRWTSLFVFPLLLHWPLMMGFMNYSLGLGLLFVIYGYWLRATEGQPRYWIGFVVFALVITVTHPVPLLILVALCCYDTATLLFSRWRLEQRTSLAELVPRGLGIVLLLMAIAYPILTVDKARVASNLTQSVFRPYAYVTDLALFRLSPYAHRTKQPLILIYMLVIYSIAIGGVRLASSGFMQRWRTRATTRTDYLLIATVAFFLGLPVLPDVINGSAWFATRLLIFVWLGVLLVASRAEFAAQRQNLWTGAAVVAWALAMLPAEFLIRPVAVQIASLERASFPAGQHGLELMADGKSRFALELKQLAFDPTHWTAMMPMMRNDDVLVNSPWMDLTISPLKPGSDQRLMFNALKTLQEKQDMQLHDGDLSYLSSSEQDKVLQATDFIFVDQPRGDGRIQNLSPEQSRAFHCEVHDWYSICRKVGSGE